MSAQSNAPRKNVLEIVNDDLRLLERDPFDGLDIVSIEAPSVPSHVFPIYAPEPREAIAAATNEDRRRLRVRASVLVPGGCGGRDDDFSHRVRLEIDVDARTYPSNSIFPRLWVRSDLAGTNGDGSLSESFYEAAKASPERKRSPIETVLWHFIHNFLREATGDESGDPQLRFKVGDDVLANIGQWAPGKVVALWDQGYPYRISLADSDMEVHAPFDSDEAVRSLITREVNAKQEEGTKIWTWPEDARVPRHAWLHNVRQWNKARTFASNHPFFRPGFSLDWWEKWLHSDVLSWLRDGRSERPYFIEELSPGIFSLSLFTAEFCSELSAEVKRCETSGEEKGIDMSRPNSMNKGGATMSELGYAPLMDSLQDCVFQHLASALFPVVGSELTRHHSFVVQYSRAEDRRGLDMHTDDSDITFNVCLGREFEGSSLQFCGMLGSPRHRRESLRYHHEVGRCVVHLGMHRHGADAIESGERINLISWNRNKSWRRSSGYLHPLHQIYYEREAGPSRPGVSQLDARCRLGGAPGGEARWRQSLDALVPSGICAP